MAIATAGNMPTSAYGGNEGQRAAMSLKATHRNTDVLAGWTTLNGQGYFLREKSPSAEDFDYTQLSSYSKFSTAVGYMGKALAAAHARADQDYDSTLLTTSMDKQIDDAVTSKSGFKSEITTFAVDYAAQVELDYASFIKARNAGTALY